MTPQTHKAIVLGPTGNLQGSVKFYCIHMGRVLKRRSFTPMPMPDHVIRRVNAIGTHEGQGCAFRFLNRRSEPYKWTDEVPEDDPEFQAEFRDFAEAALHNAGIDADEALRRAHLGTTRDGPAIIDAKDNEIMYQLTFNLPDTGLQPVDGDAAVVLGDDRNDNTAAVIPVDTAAKGRRYPTRACRSAVGIQPYDTYAPRTTLLQLRMARAHRSVLEANRLARMMKEERLLATPTTTSEPFVDDVMHRVDQAMCTTSEEELGVMAYLLTQNNLKPGLRKFGARGKKAALKEMTQLHIMDTWTPMDAGKLLREQRMRLLSSLLFLKEKRMGDIKGRACINGAPQRAYIPKEDAASSTVSTESTFITATIAVKEGRRVRCYDVPSAFVNADVDEDVIMVLKGELADMMIQIAPEVYRKYVAVDRKGTAIPYLKLQKALYGLMRASLLFYRTLRKELEQYGLVINSYDPCIANMETKSGKQLTVDLMASCKDDFELTEFSCHMGRIYGQSLSMHMGRKHDYLGVDMEFCDDGALEVSMFKFLKNMISEFPELIKGRAATPAHDKLFVIRDDEDARKLNEEQALAFHHTVEQLLFMAARARRDIQTLVAFLTTRVKSPDEDDWGKLKLVLMYLNGTKYLKLRLTMENVAVLKWYVDGSHNVHWDCKGHGGAVFTLG